MQGDAISVLAIHGRGYDERVFGSFLPRLRQEFEVTLAEATDEMAEYRDAVIIAISEATSAAVHAARIGRARGLVLMAPTPTQVLPEISLDFKPRVDEAFKLAEVVQSAAATDDQEQRRRVLADGMARLYGEGIDSEDTVALRAMFHDHADQILDAEWNQAAPQRPYEDVLADVTVPSLVIAAGGDPYAAAIAGAIAGRIPGSDLVLLDSAQILYPWLAQPDAVVQSISQFIRAI